MLRYLISELAKRQQGDGGLQGTNNDTQSSTDDDYYSPTWIAVRYAVVALLFIGLVLFFVLGRNHANRRLRAGLAPLPYHAFMVRHYGQPRYNNTYHGPSQTVPGQEAYHMNDHCAGFAPPPPYQPPPVYQPPEGASKVMADQNYNQQSRPIAPGDGGAEVPVPSASRL